MSSEPTLDERFIKVWEALGVVATKQKQMLEGMQNLIASGKAQLDAVTALEKRVVAVEGEIKALRDNFVEIVGTDVPDRAKRYVT